MTVQITTAPTGISQTVENGGTVVVPRGGPVIFQIRDIDPNGTVGPVIDPGLFQTEISGNDLIVTLPDGTVVQFEGLMAQLASPQDQGGTAGTVGTPAINSPESAFEPAIGPTSGAQGPEGGGSIQAVQSFFDDGFGNFFGVGPGGEFVGVPRAGAGSAPVTDPNLLLLLLGNLPVPQAASLSAGPAVGLEDKAIELLASVSQNDIEGQGEVLSVFVDDIPPGATIVDADGNVLFVAGAATTYETSAAELPTLSIIPPLANDDADFTVTLRAVTAEPSNPGAGTAVVTLPVPITVKAVADPAKTTLDADPGLPKNLEQQEMEGRGDSGANDTGDTAQDLGSLDGTAGSALTVDGWLDVDALNDVDVYKVEITQAGDYTFDIDFGDLDAAGNVAGRIDDADPQLFLFDAAGNELARDDDGGAGQDSLITETLAAGTYFVAVTAFNNDPVGPTLDDGFSGGQSQQFRSGDYRLQVRATPGEDGDVTPGPMITKMVLEDDAQDVGGMWVDGATDAERTQSADIDIMVTDVDGSESITRVMIELDDLPPGFMLDINGDGIFLADGANAVDLEVTRILVDGDPPAADTVNVNVDYDAATGEAVVTLDPALRVQSIDLSSFSWKVTQHDDQDFAIEITTRTTETNPSEGLGTLDTSQVATPHAYQTTTIMVNNKAVADKPMITVGPTTVYEDNAIDIGGGMFQDQTPIYSVPLEAKVVDDDGSESLTEVQLNSTDIIPFGGEPTFMGTKISTIWSGQGTFPNGTLDIEVTDAAGNTVTVTANGSFSGQGITLSFDPADRVQKVDLSDFGVQLPQHKDGKFEITLVTTSTETNPSEGTTADPDQVAVQSQSQSETFTLNVQAVADKASVALGDVTANEDNATGSPPTDGTPTFGLPVSAAVTDADGSESITEIRIDGDSLPGGSSFTASGVVAFGTGTFLGAGPLQATASLDGNDLVLTFDAALRLQTIDISAAELGVTLPQHESGSFTLETTVTTTETNPMGEVMPGAGTAVQSGDLKLTVEAVADKPEFSAVQDPVMGNEDLVSQPSGIPLDLTVATPDQDGSEGLTQFTIKGLPVNQGVGSTISYIGPGGVPTSIVDGDLDGEVTINVAGFADGDQGVTFADGKLVMIDTSQTGIDLRFTPPTDYSGSFTATVEATSTEMDPPIAVTSQTDSTEIDVLVKAVADDPTLDVSGADVCVTESAAVQTVTFDLAAALADTDGSEELIVTLSGVPAGITLNAASTGTWSATANPGEFTATFAAGVAFEDPMFDVPAGFNNSPGVDITVSATARETNPVDAEVAVREATVVDSFEFKVDPTPVANPVDAVDDLVITNSNDSFRITASALFANDTTNGATTITSVTAGTAGAALADGGLAVSLDPFDFGSSSGDTATFTYSFTDGTTSDSATVTVHFDRFPGFSGPIDGTTGSGPGNGGNEIYTRDPDGSTTTVTFAGGDDDDFFVIGDDGHVRIDGGAGFDVIQAFDGSGNTDLELVSGFGTSYGTDVEEISGSDQVADGGTADIRDPSSSGFSDWTVDFSGVTLTDIASIDGRGGEDSIIGSAGDDTILGGGDDDFIDGGPGNDRVDVGTDNDNVVFISDVGHGLDTIVSFDNEFDADEINLVDLFDDLQSDLGETMDEAERLARIELKLPGGSSGDTEIWIDTDPGDPGSNANGFALTGAGDVQIATVLANGDLTSALSSWDDGEFVVV